MGRAGHRSPDSIADCWPDGRVCSDASFLPLAHLAVTHGPDSSITSQVIESMQRCDTFKCGAYRESERQGLYRSALTDPAFPSADRRIGNGPDASEEPNAWTHSMHYHDSMKSLYYMPGRGGHLNRGLGPALAARGFDVFGREMTARPDSADENLFARLSFEQQIQVVAHDLQRLVTRDNPWVIGNSFGAYLMLHALLQVHRFEGRCLLLSPVLGPCRLAGFSFRPPQAGQLQKAIERGVFRHVAIDIVAGALDAQSPRDLCEQLISNAQGHLEMIEGDGHRISPTHVDRVLDAWL